MNPRLQVSRNAIELIKRFEGFRAGSAQLPDGRWIIGYGHTKTAREGVEIGEADAEALLLYDLIGVSHTINELVFTPLNQNQFDALAAFTFNVGAENFKASSVLKRVNEGALIPAAYALEQWRRADFEGERIVVDALVRRRAAEKTLFLTPVGGFVPAPSQVLPPKLDLEVAAFEPSAPAQALTAPLQGDQAIVERADTGATAPHDAPSATEEAAAQVTARLKSLFVDEPAQPTPATEAAAPSATQDEEEISSSPNLFGEPERLNPASDIAATPVRNPFEELRSIRTERYVSIREKPLRNNVAVWSALGAGGLAIFVIALLWGYNARMNGSPISPQAILWGLGLLGLICIGVAARFLLQRIAGEEGSED